MEENILKGAITQKLYQLSSNNFDTLETHYFSSFSITPFKGSNSASRKSKK
jgi:hypothetical protein